LDLPLVQGLLTQMKEFRFWHRISNQGLCVPDLAFELLYPDLNLDLKLALQLDLYLNLHLDDMR